MRNILKIFLVSFAFTAVPFLSNAQTPNSLILEVSPEFPEAQEEYTVKLNSYNVQRSSIAWLVDGVENISARNSSSLTLQAGNVDTTTRIIAKVTQTDGSVIEGNRTIAPNRVDLVVDADTVVPPFYKGRQLPSSGSTISATALVFTKDKLPMSSYSYVWKINNVIQNGGPIRGKNTFSFTPSFEKEVLLSVDVLASNGRTIAREAQLIPMVKPELFFYEKNPLRGLSFTALADPYLFVGEEATVRAEGYFMSRDLLGSNVLREWKINGRSASGGEEPEEITIQKEGNSGSAKLGFHVRNLAQLLQGVQKTITLKF